MKQKCLCSRGVGVLLHGSGGLWSRAGSAPGALHPPLGGSGCPQVAEGQHAPATASKVQLLQGLLLGTHPSCDPARPGCRAETTQQVISLLGFMTPIEDAWILRMFLHCAFPHTVRGSLINGDSLHSESLDSNDGLARFSLPFGFLLRKGFAKQFNHLKQECQSYS